MADTTHLFTTVKNPTANAITYGYLGSHGKRLAGGATYTFLGHLDAQVRRGHGSRPGGRRDKSLQRDLLAGRLQILSTPPPVFLDTSPAAPVANPAAAPTVAVTGGGTTGGALAAGTYYARYTWVTSIGETAASPESTQFTVAAGNIPRVTIPALPTGAVSARVYLTPTNGASGSETLYRSGVTTTTTDLNVAYAAGGSGPPAANTAAVGNVKALKVTNGVLGSVDPSWGAYAG